MSKQERPNLRTSVIRAAEDADVELSDYDRAIVLGQLAELIGKHPKVGGKIAFKGGAIMTMVDQSPRSSRDLDGAMISGSPVSEAVIRQALSTPEARKIVKRVDRFSGGDDTSIRFPVIVCHPMSGQGEVNLSMSIHWDAPLILKPVRETVDVHGRAIKLLTMARIERIAEKVRAFVSRGAERDAYDLYYSWAVRGLSGAERKQLASLIARKINQDPDIEVGTDLHIEFNTYLRTLASDWGQSSQLILPGGAVPAWKSVRPAVEAFKQFIPKVKESDEQTAQRGR